MEIEETVSARERREDYVYKYKPSKNKSELVTIPSTIYPQNPTSTRTERPKRLAVSLTAPSRDDTRSGERGWSWESKVHCLSFLFKESI